MSIQTELTRITNAKAAIKTAIEGKGVDVPSGAKLDALAALIESIQAGGGGGESVCKIGSFTPETDISPYSTPYTIQHGLGKIPKAFFVYVSQRDAWGTDSYSVLFAYGIEIDAGGIKTVISTGSYSQDENSDKFKNAVIAFGAGYSKNKPLQSTNSPNANNTLKVYEATEETINLMYKNTVGKLRGGWTYTWIAL